jgi:hypothetical protein
MMATRVLQFHVEYCLFLTIHKMSTIYKPALCHSNDIARNASSNELTHIMKFLMRNKYTNIILINAPHRFDLSDSSCVNEEVKSFQ